MDQRVDLRDAWGCSCRAVISIVFANTALETIPLKPAD